MNDATLSGKGRMAESSLSTPERYQVVVVHVGLGVITVTLTSVIVFQLLDEVVGRGRDGVGVRRELPVVVRHQSKVQNKFW